MWFSTPRLLAGLYGLSLAVVGSSAVDVDFMSVRPTVAKEYSGKGGEPGPKYFSKFWPRHIESRQFAGFP